MRLWLSLNRLVYLSAFWRFDELKFYFIGMKKKLFLHLSELQRVKRHLTSQEPTASSKWPSFLTHGENLAADISLMIDKPFLLVLGWVTVIRRMLYRRLLHYKAFCPFKGNQMMPRYPRNR